MPTARLTRLPLFGLALALAAAAGAVSAFLQQWSLGSAELSPSGPHWLPWASAGLVLAVGLAGWLLRRRPLVDACLVWALAVGLGGWPGRQPAGSTPWLALVATALWPLAVVTAYHLGRRRRGWLPLVLGLAVAALRAGRYWLDMRATWGAVGEGEPPVQVEVGRWVATAFAAYGVEVLLPVLLGVLVRQEIAVGEQAAHELDQERAEREQLLASAVHDDRRRMAHELHNLAAHHSTAVVVNARAARKMGRQRPELVPELMDGIVDESRAAQDSLRQLVRLLNDPEEAPLEPQPSLAEVPALVEHVRQGFPDVVLDFTDVPVPTPVALAVPDRPGGPDQCPALRTGRAADRLRRPRGQPVGGGGDQWPGVRPPRGRLGLRTGDRRHASTRGAARWQAAGRAAPAWLAGAGRAPPGAARRGTADTPGPGRDDPTGGRGRGAAMTRVLVADDQAVVRRGLALLLSGEDGIEVVGEAGNGPEAVRLARRLEADVVLMDVRMPGGDGLAATRELAATDPHPAVVVVTTFDLDEYIFGAMEAGAAGFLLKDCEPEELAAAVRAAAAGQAMVQPRVTRRVLAEFARRRPAPDPCGPGPGNGEVQLSPRERELVHALCQGMSNAELAEQLCIEVSTVKTHLARISARHGLRDRVQLVVWAYRHGLD